MRKIKPSFIEANLGYEVIEVEFVPSDDSPVIKPLMFFNNAFCESRGLWRFPKVRKPRHVPAPMTLIGDVNRAETERS